MAKILGLGIGEGPPLRFNQTSSQLTPTVTLRLTNTLTRRTELFEPLEPGRVSIYCCGVTVYDLCHLGHARSYIAWDVLRRHLIWSGYQVKFVQNYTDIDDKILGRAARVNIDCLA